MKILIWIPALGAWFATGKTVDKLNNKTQMHWVKYQTVCTAVGIVGGLIAFIIINI